jgi:Uma2 family endonuclease
MSEPAKKEATYEDLLNVPENMIGEIIDGELIVSPRPTRRHVHVTSLLGVKLTPPYHFGEGGGPGGWIIYDEPEIQFDVRNILVPDLAGWRRERLTMSPEEHRFTTAPDWICEVLSPSSARNDRISKMRTFIQYRAPHVWLIDPILTTLEAYKIEPDGRLTLSAFMGNEKARVEPFPELDLDLSVLWLEE